MLFFGGRSRLRPRRFVYFPSYYKPEKDRERRDRFNFKRRTRHSRISRTPGISPFLYLLLALLIVAVMYLLSPGRFGIENAGEMELTPEDVPPVQTRE